MERISRDPDKRLAITFVQGYAPKRSLIFAPNDLQASIWNIGRVEVCDLFATVLPLT